jgi:hypothetical protein
VTFTANKEIKVAICTACGKENYNEGGVLCPDCNRFGWNSTEADAVKVAENATLSPTTFDKASAQVVPRTTAAKLAYLSAGILAICSGISCLFWFGQNEPLMGLIALVSGLGGAIFLMVLAEISLNIAGLVELANK